MIGVLGRDPFGATLDEIVRGETVNGRPLVVRRYESVDQVDTCHILFIDRSQDEQLDADSSRAQGPQHPHRRRFRRFRTAAAASFVSSTVGNRIRLRVNLAAAEQAKLTISSKLLRPAQIVETGQD